MSRTPRTDKAEKFVYGRVDQKYVEPCEMRQLERELTEAVAKCGKLEQLRMEWMETARLSQDRAFSNFNELMASQARECQLREALETTLEVLKSNGWDWKSPSVEMAEAALSLPPPQVVALAEAQALVDALDHIRCADIFDVRMREIANDALKTFKSEYPKP